MAKSPNNFSSLRNREIEFLEENIDHFSVVNEHCVGYFDGKREELEDILERFLLISSTCFVRKDLHSREKDHQRFSKSCRLLLILYYLIEAWLQNFLLTSVTQFNYLLFHIMLNN